MCSLPWASSVLQPMRGYVLPGEGECVGHDRAQEGTAGACVSLFQVEQCMEKRWVWRKCLKTGFLFQGVMHYSDMQGHKLPPWVHFSAWLFIMPKGVKLIL